MLSPGFIYSALTTHNVSAFMFAIDVTSLREAHTVIDTATCTVGSLSSAQVE